MNTRLLYANGQIPVVEEFDDMDLLTVLLGKRANLGNMEAVISDNTVSDASAVSLSSLAKILESDPADFLNNGISKTNALKLACIAELCKRLWKVKTGYRECIDCAETAANYYLQDLRYEDQEHVFIMYLDPHNRLIESVHIGKGTSDSCSVSPRDILRQGLKLKASGMIMIHNHPSGVTSPSSEDIKFTRSLRDAGKLMDVKLKDSIIIGDNTYLSMMEQGLF